MLVLNIFSNLWESINNFFIDKLGFDQFFFDLYDKYFYGINEVFKWLLFLLLLIVVVLGTISLIKKTFKLFLVIAIVTILIVVFSRT